MDSVLSKVREMTMNYNGPDSPPRIVLKVQAKNPAKCRIFVRKYMKLTVTDTIITHETGQTCFWFPGTVHLLPPPRHRSFVNDEIVPHTVNL